MRTVVQDKPSPREVSQIKVTVKDIQPPIWRRLQVRSDITLDKLHGVLQAVMGWTGSHHHQFIIDGRLSGEPDSEDATEVIDERKVRLAEVVSGEKAEFVYEYDFGDRWEHEVVVEQILAVATDTPLGVCLAGERNSPPEDCGGVVGYAELLDAIQNPDHPQHQEMLGWVRGRFDPEAFDLAKVNRALAAIR